MKTNNTQDLDADSGDEFGFLWMCGACETKPTYITIYDLFAHKRERHGLEKSTPTSGDHREDGNDEVPQRDIVEPAVLSTDINSNGHDVSSEEDAPLSTFKRKNNPLTIKLKSEGNTWLLEHSFDIYESTKTETKIDNKCGTTEMPQNELNTSPKLLLTDLIPTDSDLLRSNDKEDEVSVVDINQDDSDDNWFDEGESENYFPLTSINEEDITISRKQYRCKICETIFDSRKLLSQHNAIHACPKVKKEKLIINRKQHKCKICEEIFESRKHLSQHKIVHLCPETGLFQCNTCGKRCGKYDNFTRHLWIHKDNRVKSFTCFYCSSSFYNMADLRRHVLLHAEVKPFMCQDCGKGFIKEDSLNVHMAKHTGVLYEKFRCKHCGKILNSPSALAMHSKNHTSKSIFCSEPDCTFSCYMKSQLRQHMRRHNGEKPFQCALCGRCFARSNDMKNHILNVHERIRPYKCPDCPKEFTLPSSLKSHRLTHLDIRPYLCAECGKRFSHQSTLRKHINFRHRHLCDPCTDEKHFKPKTGSPVGAPLNVDVKMEEKFSESVHFKDATFGNAAVPSLPVVTIPIHIPQLAVNLEQGFGQTYFIPTVTLPPIVKPGESL